MILEIVYIDMSDESISGTTPEDIFQSIHLYEEITNDELDRPREFKGFQVMIVKENPFGESNTIVLAIRDQTLVVIDQAKDSTDYDLQYSKCIGCEEYEHCHKISSITLIFSTLASEEIVSVSKICDDCYSYIIQETKPIVEEIDSSETVSHLL